MRNKNFNHTSWIQTLLKCCWEHTQHWKPFVWNTSLLISNMINSIIRDDYNEQCKQQEMALSWGSFAGSPPPPNTYKRASQPCVMNKGLPTVSLRIVFPMLAHCVYCCLSWWWMSDYSAASVSLTKRRWLWEHTPNTHTHPPPTSQHVMAHCFAWPPRLWYQRSCGNDAGHSFIV